MAQVAESSGHIALSDPVGEDHFLYIYEEEPDAEVEELLDRAVSEEEVTVEKEDSSKWSEEERWEFYLERLIPLAFHNRKDLRGRIKAKDSGVVRMKDSVLITGDRIYIGKEEQKSMLKDELGVEA